MNDERAIEKMSIKLDSIENNVNELLRYEAARVEREKVRVEKEKVFEQFIDDHRLTLERVKREHKLKDNFLFRVVFTVIGGVFLALVKQTFFK